MGRVVTLAEIQLSAAGDGVASGPVTAGDLVEFAAERVQIGAGKTWQVQGAAGADTYLFALSGAGDVASGSARHAFPAQTFATLAADARATVTATGSVPLELLLVRTPLADRPGVPGFTGALAVAERARCPVVPIPAEHKQRIYFCGHHGGAYTERGHAMIVVYDGETHTRLHHHPDAESMFVLLDGACEFTVEGRQEIVGPGQVAYFRMRDLHGLKTAPGHAGASFLEFHIPAKFSTVKT